jgi:thioredoxin 1
MIKTRIQSTLFATLILGLALATGCSASNAKPAKAQTKPREAITKALDAKKPVMLFFYAERIKDSKKSMDKVKKAAAENKAVFVPVEAEEDADLRYDYAIEYVPTVVVLKPGVGVSDVFVRDLPAADKLGRTLKKDFKLTGRMNDINAAIKSKKPVLLFFMADWCGYCQRVQPEVEAFKRDFGDQVHVITVDLDTLARGDVIDFVYAVEGVPVLVALKNNGAVHRRMGYGGDAYKMFKDAFSELGVKEKKTTGKKS